MHRCHIKVTSEYFPLSETRRKWSQGVSHEPLGIRIATLTPRSSLSSSHSSIMYINLNEYKSLWMSFSAAETPVDREMSQSLWTSHVYVAIVNSRLRLTLLPDINGFGSVSSSISGSLSMASEMLALKTVDKNGHDFLRKLSQHCSDLTYFSVTCSQVHFTTIWVGFEDLFRI